MRGESGFDSYIPRSESARDFRAPPPFRNSARMRFSLLILCLVVCIPEASAQVPGPRVAVTIDDGPVTGLDTSSHPGIVQGLLDALRTHEAPASLFVVTGGVEDNPESMRLLKMWIDAGVEIGNHSHSHVSLNDLGNERYHEDIRRAQDILHELLGDTHPSVRYFRAPYLQDGATESSRDSLRFFLDEQSLQYAPATIALEDWRFNGQYQEAIRRGDRAEQDRIGQEYLNHAREMIDRFELLGVQLTRRRLPHVLLLHANVINRDYLEDVLGLFIDRGFSFVTLDEVYSDPLYDRIAPPDKDGASYLIRLAREDGLYAE